MYVQTPWGKQLATEIMARQCLNAEVAALRATTHPSTGGGPMDWLLHIDIDELFAFPGNPQGRGPADVRVFCVISQCQST